MPTGLPVAALVHLQDRPCHLALPVVASVRLQHRPRLLASPSRGGMGTCRHRPCPLARPTPASQEQLHPSQGTARLTPRKLLSTPVSLWASLVSDAAPSVLRTAFSV